MNEGNRAKTAAAPAVAVLALDTRFHEHIPMVLPFRPELADAFAANDAHPGRDPWFGRLRRLVHDDVLQWV